MLEFTEGVGRLLHAACPQARTVVRTKPLEWSIRPSLLVDSRPPSSSVVLWAYGVEGVRMDVLCSLLANAPPDQNAFASVVQEDRGGRRLKVISDVIL